MDSTKKLLIGAISGNYQIKDVSRWIESSNTFDCERILILYNNTNNELYDYLVKNKIDVIVPESDMYGQYVTRFETNTGNNDIDSSYNLIHNIRFLHIWQILNEKEYDSVLITDVRDVYFNRDPFVTLGVDWLFASSEEIEYRNENWNKHHLFVNLGGIGADILMDKPVYNVGVFGGSAELVKKISRDIYLMSIGRKLVADQTSFNYLIQTTYKDFVRFTNLSDKFAVHLDVIAKGLVQFDLNTLNDYTIIHQYDRL
jgi:hypothetical protein